MMSNERLRPGVRGKWRLAAFALVLSGTAMLGGCGSTLGGMPLIGEPKETPAAPAKTPAFPSIGEAVPQPADKPLTPAERQKAEDALEAARTQAVIDRRKQINGSE